MSEQQNMPPLPRPTVRYVFNPGDINEATARGMMSNPIYVGVPPYQRIVADEAWVKAAIELIKDEGPEQFLVNMLYMLRTSMVDALPDEIIPENYDGPWPGDDDALFEDEFDAIEPDSPWQNPLEGFIFCSHDDLPMILIDDEFVCVGEYLFAHLNDSPVNDLVTKPVLTLVFRNGHTLPLYCPSCGDSLHITEENELLDNINGLTMVDVEWEPDMEELLIYFADQGSDEEDFDDEAYPMLAVHLKSVRELTCPYKSVWHNDEGVS